MVEVHHPPRRGGKAALLRQLWHRTPTGNEPGAEFGGAIVFPQPHTKAPLRQVLRRLVLAQLVFIVTTLLVYLDRNGYNDNSDGHVDFLDAAYYTTVSLSTTGYGDITPVNDVARLTNIFVITPLRILFLIILVGTTLEVLTDKTRQQVRTHRWRSRMRDHTVVVGYGTKGRHTIETLIVQGTPKEKIVIIEPQKKVVEAATNDGFVAIQGDATRSETLLRAELQRATHVVIATQRDDTAALVTLTARQLNQQATIVAAVREDENVPLLRQSGADAVITSSSSAGCLLGMSTMSPYAGTVLEGLLTQGNGLDVVERPVTPEEAGHSPRVCEDLVLAVVRGGQILHFTDPAAETLEADDHVVTVRQAEPIAALSIRRKSLVWGL